MIADVKLCECGCGEPAPISTRNRPAQGHVLGQPLRFIFNHDKRVEPQYRVDPGSGCWVWLNARTKAGYPKMRGSNGGQAYAHRHFYEQAKGPIPAGLQIDHLCRNPACVNPDHLEPVTCRENVHRGRGTKLQDEDVRAIRASVESPTALAVRYGVTPKHICALRSFLRRAAA